MAYDSTHEQPYDEICTFISICLSCEVQNICIILTVRNVVIPKYTK